MADDITKYGLDASQAISEADKLADAFEQLSKRMAQSFQKVTQNFGADGKLISTTINSIIGSLGKLTETIDAQTGETVSKLKLLPTAYTVAGEAANRYTNQLLRLSQQASKTILAPDPTAYSKNLLSNPQITKLIADADNIKNIIEKSRTLSKQSGQEILTGLTKGIAPSNLTGDTLKLSQAYVQLTKDASGITNISKYIQDIIKYTTLATNVTNNFYKSLIPTSKQALGSPAEILGVQKAGQGLTTAIDTSGLQPKQLEKVFAQLGTGDFKNITPQAQGIADAFLRVQSAIKQVGIESGQASNALQNLTRGRKEDLDKYTLQIRSAFESRQGTPVAFGVGEQKTQGLNEAYSAQLLRVGAAAQNIKATAAEINTAFNAALSGNKIAPLKDGLETLRLEFVKLISTSRDFGSETVKASDKSSEALARADAQVLKLIADAARYRSTQAVLPKAFTDVQSLTAGQKGFGPVPADASVGQIAKINAAYAKLAQTIVSTGITQKEFAVEVANIGSKGIIPPSANAGINEVRTGLVGLSGALEQVEKRTGLFAGAFLQLADIGRIFGRLQIYRIFSSVNQVIEDGIKNASEFGRQIALIRTITQDALVSSDAWAKSLTELSNQLGRPVTEIAKSAYDALSNQITKSKDDTVAFIEAAGTFGRTVGTDSTQAVNLFSTAIKGFGVDVSDTERIAKTFFNTIDYGRVTAEGLTATLGRIAPLAKDLGVSLEEVGAAQVVLTRGGFNPQEAGTRVANFLLAFEKPTKQFQEFIANFGAQTPKQFLAVTGGLGGAINEIAKAFEQGNVAAKELFPEIRKIQAALALAAESGQTFEQALKDVGGHPERYEAAKKITEDTFSQKAKEQITQLTNVFVELGTKIQSVFVNLSDLSKYIPIANVKNLAETLVEVVRLATEIGLIFLGYKSSILIIEGLSAAFAALTINIGSTGAALNAVNATNLFAAVATASFTATYLLIQKNRDAYANFLEETRKNVQLGINNELETLKNNLTGLKDSVKNTLGELAKDTAQQTASGIATLTKAAEGQKKVVDQLQKSTEHSFNTTLDDLEVGIQNIERAAKKASTFSQEAKNNIYTAQYSAGREFFDRRISEQRDIFQKQGGQGLGAGEVNLTLNRVQTLRQEAAKLSAQFETNPQVADRLNHVLEESKNLLSSLAATPNLSLRNKVYFEQLVTQQLQLQVAIYARQEEKQKELAINLTKEAGLQKDILGKIKDQFKTLEDLVPIDKKTGKLIEPDITGTKETKSREDKLADLYKKRKDTENNIIDLIQKLDTRQSKQPGLTQREGLSGGIQARLSALRQEFAALDNAVRQQGKTASTADELSKSNIQLNNTIDKTNTSIAEQSAKITELTTEYDKARVAVELYTVAIKKSVGEPTQGLFTEQPAVLNPVQINNILDSVRSLTKQPENIGQVVSSIEALQKTAGKQGLGETTISSLDAEGKAITVTLHTLLDGLRNTALKIEELGPQIGARERAVGALTANLERLKTNLDPIPTALTGTAKAFTQFRDSLVKEPEKLNSTMGKIIGNLEILNNRLIRLNNQPKGGFGVNDIQSLFQASGLFSVGLRPPEQKSTFPSQTAINTLANQPFPSIPQSKIIGIRGNQINFNEPIQSQLPNIPGTVATYNPITGSGYKPIESQQPKIPGTIGAFDILRGSHYEPIADPTAKFSESLNTLTTAIQGAAISIENIQIPSKPLTESMGGLINYYGKGGYTGTDTVPAMLTPKEYVMPVGPTAKYFNILENMRNNNYQSGGMVDFAPYSSPKLQSSYYNQGGTVNHANTNFGDIHVNIHGDTKDPNFGRQVAQELRKELRKGTIKLN